MKQAYLLFAVVAGSAVRWLLPAEQTIPLDATVELHLRRYLWATLSNNGLACYYFHHNFLSVNSGHNSASVNQLTSILNWGWIWAPILFDYCLNTEYETQCMIRVESLCFSLVQQGMCCLLILKGFSKMQWYQPILYCSISPDRVTCRPATGIQGLTLNPV